ncbi:App1 family protein [Hymenobacter koreensis]|uniref:App1 family protein n=1 Tax=Hymenobacter koreensis TaxID=1084523 RepID=A0ABP8J7Z7_9BACT
MPLLDRLSEFAENADDLLRRARTRLGLLHPVQVLPYRSYGTPERLYVKGRVLTDKGITDPDPSDSRWHNLLNMYRRFDSQEIPGAQLRVRPGDGTEHHVITDEEGYFTLNLEPQRLNQPVDFLWHQVEVELMHAPGPQPAQRVMMAPVLVPPADAEYGIISDLDDTVIQTSATDLLRMARTVLLRNARSRLPFKGVAEFYRQLQLGRNGKRNNPFFYVSSSPWNLYDLLEDFLTLNEIPPGPLLLRDMAVKRKASGDASEHHGHKLREIDNLLLTYPQLPFVLIGDSGQEDANIYREVVRRHPGRVLAIYIRDVNLPQRAALVTQVSEDLRGHEVEMLLVKDTVQAAEHAAQTGLVFNAAVEAVEAEKQKDEATPEDPGEVAEQEGK